MKALLALVLLCLSPLCAAQAVALHGMMGKKALLIIDGGAPRAVGAGESLQGVTVISTTHDSAVVEVARRQHVLKVGESPASVGRTGSVGQTSGESPVGKRIVMMADSGGHFLAQGSINGKAVLFMVDTGATVVSLGAADAERMGLDYKSGQSVRLGTANGAVRGWQVKLASVRIGDVELYEVDAVVGPMTMPYALLGNSFLSRFQMKRENDQMVLERRF